MTASGVTTVPSASVTDSPRWSAPRSGPNGTPSASAASRVELAGPVGLVDGVADRRDAVVNREDEDPVAVALERLARAHLDRLERVREPAEHAAEVG